MRVLRIFKYTFIINKYHEIANNNNSSIWYNKYKKKVYYNNKNYH